MTHTQQHHPVKGEPTTKKPKRAFVFSALMLLNHIAVVALVISYLAPYISPEKLWIVAFFGLTYPFWVAINLLFVIGWLVLLPKRAWYSFIVVISGWLQLTTFIQFTPRNAYRDLKNPIKIMSYNVKLFDLYDWNHNGESRNRFFDLIKEQRPDIMCLQEFYTSEANDIYHLNNLDTLLKLQKAANVFTVYTTTLRSTDHWGDAIFSIYPIVNKGKINFETRSNNVCMYCDLKINDDTVRVYNLHLQSIHFNKVDHKFWNDLMKNRETQELENSKNIFRRLKMAYIKRANQADMVAQHIAASPYPVIVCGDFNDTPCSYTYHTISKNLKDAFMESGSGLGRSYEGEFPSFRIDYILHSNNYQAQNFYTIQKPLSDHYPVCCYLVKNSN